MEYLTFSEEKSNEYNVDITLLDHSNISDSNRAVRFEYTERLFTWLSEECSRQKICREAYVLTCAYIDLFFMKRNDIELGNYQILALGALILATKQVEIEGKLPSIDIHLFKLEDLLNMEKRIIFSLSCYLNPPLYTELINNVAKSWDVKCESGEIGSKVRYFQENKTCFLRLKLLYEKMDCLNLFKKILNFDIQDVVFTLFYLETKTFHNELNKHALPNSTGSLENPEEMKDFDEIFREFLSSIEVEEINKKEAILSIVSLLTKEKFKVNEEVPNQGLTFTQLLSYQTHNRFGYEFYKKNQAQINKL